MITSYDNNHPPWKTINNDGIFHRVCFACGVYKKRHIVVAGGTKTNEKLNSVVMYDTFTQQQIVLPNLPFSGECGGAVIQHYFYVFKYYSRHDRFRINLHQPSSWESLGCMRRRTVYNDIISDGNELFLINTDNEHVDRYNPTTKKITMMTNLLTHRNYFASAVVGNQFFTIGGRKLKEYFSKVEVFNIDDQRWSEAPALPVPLRLVTATVYRKWIIVSGGYDEHWKYNTKTFIYDTKAMHKQWTQHDSNILSPPQGHKCVVIESNIISLGGLSRIFLQRPMQSIYIEHIIPGWRWELVKDFVLLRQLVDEYRASPIISTRKNNHSGVSNWIDTHLNVDVNLNISKNKNNAIQKLIMEMALDIFSFCTSWERIKTQLVDEAEVGGYNVKSIDSQIDEVIQKLFTDVSLDIFRNVLSFCI